MAGILVAAYLKLEKKTELEKDFVMRPLDRDVLQLHGVNFKRIFPQHREVRQLSGLNTAHFPIHLQCVGSIDFDGIETGAKNPGYSVLGIEIFDPA